jgi:tRNA pseudouridine38-40 synthase
LTDAASEARPLRVALRVAYRGTGYPGWQTQPSGDSIQDRLEAALSRIAGHPVATVCAGRTDAGVHALAQVVHFDTAARRPLSAWTRGVNSHLPDGIAAQRACVVEADFHARYGARRRSYTYVLYRGAERHPLAAGRAGWVFRALDVARMDEAARALVGEHDFSAFRSSQCQAASPVRTLEAVTLRERGSLLAVDLVGNAFLHHMVRNVVGALVWVGLGRRPAGWVAELLAGRDRTQGAPTFAADGLYLTGVRYEHAVALGTWPPADPVAWPGDPA